MDKTGAYETIILLIVLAIYVGGGILVSNWGRKKAMGSTIAVILFILLNWIGLIIIALSKNKIEKEQIGCKHVKELNPEVRTDGIYIAKPSSIGTKFIEPNICILLLFNKNGIVYIEPKNYDEILNRKNSYFNQFRNFDIIKSSSTTALFKITNGKLQWKCYDPDSESNKMLDEPLDYSEFEGEFLDIDLIVTSQMSYYDQSFMKYITTEGFKNVVFKFHKINNN